MTKKTIQLGNGEILTYQLERRARRTVGLKITDDGLVVHAPKYLLEFQLKNLILKKSDWISNKLATLKLNQKPPITWQDGETIPLLGLDMTLYIVSNSKKQPPQFNHDSLTIVLPQPEDEEVVKKTVIQWYKKQALTDFGRRIALFAAKLGVTTPPFKLSNARSRWGSCTSQGDIRLNWRLIQAPPSIINYVVCHELAHLKEMNHSAQYWAIVEGIYPHYKAAEKELKQLSAVLHRM